MEKAKQLEEQLADLGRLSAHAGRNQELQGCRREIERQLPENLGFDQAPVASLGRNLGPTFAKTGLARTQGDLEPRRARLLQQRACF